MMKCDDLGAFTRDINLIPAFVLLAMALIVSGCLPDKQKNEITHVDCSQSNEAR